MIWIIFIILSSSSISAFADNNTADYIIPPGGQVMPVIQQSCDASQLVIYIDYMSTTDLSIYVYPPSTFSGCSIMPYYYTALGYPTIPDSTNLTAWYVSDIMDGLTCFGIQNDDTENIASVNIFASMECTLASSGPGGTIARGWYFRKPSAEIHPDIVSSSSSSTGLSPDSNSNGTATSGAIEKSIPNLFMILGSVTLIMMI